jgi:hypothetical protein
MSEQYQRVYEVALLDDLHNFFPALLYNQDLFRTVPDVLGYIRQRTQRRFNLFEYGRRQYEASMPMPPQNMYMPRAPPQVIPVRQARAADPAFNTLLQYLRGPGAATGATGAATGAAGAARARIYEDVVVHASQDIINEVSTETTLVEDFEDNCAICQDRMRQGELVRRLTSCQHTFHRTCVDNWLLNQSVFCPTCRHDIRVITASADTTTAAVPTAPVPTAVVPAPTTTLETVDIAAADLINILFGRSSLY